MSTVPPNAQDKDHRIQDIERSLLDLEARINSLRNTASQKTAFLFFVIVQSLIAGAICLFSRFVPIPICNGWMLGSFATACVWFAASTRSMMDRIVRLVISIAMILWSVDQACGFVSEPFPNVVLFGVILFPVMSISGRLVVAIYRTGVRAPDQRAEQQPSPLTIREVMLYFFVMAIVLSFTRFSLGESLDASTANKLAILLAYSSLTGVLYASGIVTFTRLRNWRCQVPALIVIGLAFSLLCIGALTRLGYEEVSQFSVIEDQSHWAFPFGSAQVAADPEIFTPVLLFVFTAIAPLISTILWMRFQNYRFVVGTA